MEHQQNELSLGQLTSFLSTFAWAEVTFGGMSINLDEGIDFLLSCTMGHLTCSSSVSGNEYFQSVFKNAYAKVFTRGECALLKMTDAYPSWLVILEGCGMGSNFAENEATESKILSCLYINL